MKSYLLLTTLCLTAFAAFAQQKPSAEATQFLNYSVQIDNDRQAATKDKDYPRAVKLINEWLERYEKEPADSKQNVRGYEQTMYYNLACYDALQGQTGPAFAALEKSVQTGFSDYKNMLGDADLASLHGDKRFDALIEKVHEKGDYGYLLKKSGPYDKRDHGHEYWPQFTYQPSNSPELVELRTKFNLDSVSGNGDEITRIKNLLHWAHNAVRHDGNSGNPKVKNAIDLIAVCKAENRGVNCRMMATILKDAYQAEGFEARIVTCLPKDTNDFDCHVINVVWSKSLNKWVWMDPTFNAYVSDEKGNLLNIREVRERIISGAPLVVNDDANWNNQVKQTKAQYLDYYMSKNLYWLQCPTVSTWNQETRTPGKGFISYVNLYPGGFSTTKNMDLVTEDDRKLYATNNPDYFWQKPEGEKKVKSQD